MFLVQKGNKKRSLFFIVCVLIFQTSQAKLFSEITSNTIIEQYREGTKALDDAIMNGQTHAIRTAIEVLHNVYDKNQNFFEVIRDIAHGYYMLGDFANALLYTQKALKFRRDDEALQVLQVQLLMRTVPVDHIRINKEVSKKIRNALDALLQNASYNPYVLYTASMYFKIIGDKKNYHTTRSKFHLLYKNDKKYEHIASIYAIIDAIHNKQISDESEKAFVTLQNYGSNLWFIWLLLHYMGVFYINNEGAFVDEAMLEMFQTYTKRLIKSDTVFLQRAGYVMRFNVLFYGSKFKEARNTAKEYSESFATHSDAWVRYGIALYEIEDYGSALQAFTRAQEVRANNTFVQFMYDITLQKALQDAYEDTKNLAEKRVNALVEIANDALSRGDGDSAIQNARRALYIMPLNVDARVLSADILRQQGYLADAEEELSLLEDIDEMSSDVIRKLQSIRAEIHSAFDDYPHVRKLIDASSFSHISYDPIAWNIHVKPLTYNRNETYQMSVLDERNLTYAQRFFTKYLEYALTRFSSIRVGNDENTKNAPHLKSIALELSYSDTNGLFSTSAHLTNEESLEHITNIVETRRGNNRVEAAFYALAWRIYNSLPFVMPILAKSGNNIVLGHGKYTSMNNVTLPIFNNGTIQVSTQDPYFISSGELIGFAKINASIAHNNIATLQKRLEPNALTNDITKPQEELQKKLSTMLSKPYAKKTFSLFTMRSVVNVGDVVIVPPTEWQDDRKHENIALSIAPRLLTVMRIQLW